ncbi:YwpF family protein [Shouchella shacheensis]|uniref:YwpF family protein n=1 Tax=Shouchella shacheensis TaxID=1649580 RepID=UPI00073FCBA5|nr:YwpF family protein [Shouchella shacheensis]
MKTFKLYTLHVLDGKEGSVQQHHIPLNDGLIINMENEEATWFIDAVVPKEHAPFFEKELEEQRHLLVSVVITSKNNHPAVMITTIETTTDLEKDMSIVLKGKIVLGRDDILEDIFEDLLEEEYEQKEEMLIEFRKRVEQLEAYSDRTIEEVYNAFKQNNKYQLL